MRSHTNPPKDQSHIVHQRLNRGGKGDYRAIGGYWYQYQIKSSSSTNLDTVPGDTWNWNKLKLKLKLKLGPILLLVPLLIWLLTLSLKPILI